MEICCDLCGREFAVADYCYDLLGAPGAPGGSPAGPGGAAAETVEESVSAFESEALASVREPQPGPEGRQDPLRPFSLGASGAGRAAGLAGYSRYLCSQCYHTLCGGVLQDLQNETAHCSALAAQTAVQAQRAAELSRLLALSEREPGPGPVAGPRGALAAGGAKAGGAAAPAGGGATDDLLLQLLREEEELAALEARLADAGGAAPGTARGEGPRDPDAAHEADPPPEAPPARPGSPPREAAPDSPRPAPDPANARPLPFIPVSARAQTVGGHRLCKKNGIQTFCDEINAALCDLALLVQLLSRRSRTTRGKAIKYDGNVMIAPVLPSPVIFVSAGGKDSLGLELFVAPQTRFNAVTQKLGLAGLSGQRDRRLAAGLTALVGRLVEVLLVYNVKAASPVIVPKWAVDFPLKSLGNLYNMASSVAGRAEGGSPAGGGGAGSSQPAAGRKPHLSRVSHSGGVSFPDLNIEITKVASLDLHENDGWAVLNGKSVFVTDRDDPAWAHVAREILLLVEGARAAVE